MRFLLGEDVFDTLEDVCFCVVVARGIDNATKTIKLMLLLQMGA